MRSENWANVLECNTITYQKHYFPWHLHPGYYSFSLILSGEAEVIWSNQKVKLVAGDILIIPPHLAHQTIVPHHMTYRIIRLSLERMQPPEQLQASTPIIRNVTARKAFQSWYEELKRKSVPDRIKGFHRQSFGKHQQDLDWLTAVVHFIHQHFSETITLNQLSQLAFLSPSHFQRQFKKRLGISPMRYLLSLRIDKAKALIKAGQKMTDVAHLTGFYDQSHFNKYFKIYAGMSPTHFLGTSIATSH